MDDRRQTLIEELQSLEEPTKKKILVISTVIIMVIIIYFWLAYFNGIFVTSAPQAPVADAGQGSPGLWGNMKNGTAMVYQSVFGSLVWLGHILNAPRQYIVKPMP